MASPSPPSDRFSTLPDSVLLHIFSFLPFDEVIRTSLVAKQCKSLWAFSSSLIFTHRTGISSADFLSLRKFISFVDKSLLLLHPSNTITKLHLDFPFKRRFSADVTVWLLFALSHSVKELNLLFFNDQDDHFLLPRRVFEYPFWERLNLCMCNLGKIEMIKWAFLKELKIGSSELKDDVMTKIVVGSPFLESLELYNSWGFEHLSFINHEKLTKLVVDGYGNLEQYNFGSLIIEAPTVKQLEIVGGFGRMHIDLRNLRSCVSIKLDFHLSPPNEHERETYYELQQPMLMGNLVHLRHVKSVTFGTWCIEVISTWNQRHSAPFYLSDCECLTLHTPIQGRYLPGIFCLLQCSPNVQTLIIHVAPSYFEFEALSNLSMIDVYCLGGRFLTSGFLGDLFFRIKNIEVVGFQGQRCGYEIPFLQYLLQRSMGLERMVLNWSVGPQNSISTADPSQEEAAQSLLHFPRVSPRAKILFKC